MSIAYLAQAGQQQQLEWLAGGTMSILLDSEATKGQLLVARSRTSEGMEESELAEGGIIFLPKNVPHAYRITSAKAEMLIICTPGGNESLYRYVGRDRATQRPDGWAITPERLVEGAKMVGNVVLGPPR